jgi:hypothetical protein
MKKLSLKLDELAVESFDTGAGKERNGTVHGQASGGCDPSILDSCPPPGGQSCAHAVSCGGSCWDLDCTIDCSQGCTADASCVVDENSCVG